MRILQKKLSKGDFILCFYISAFKYHEISSKDLAFSRYDENY